MLTRDRIRLALETTTKNTPASDVLSGSTPTIWRANDVAFEFAVFVGGTLLASLANIDSITMVATAYDDRQSALVLTGIVRHADLAAITLDDWNAGTAQHGTIAISGDFTALDLDGKTSRDFWLSFYALTTDVPAKKITLGSSLLTVQDDGSGAANSPLPEPPAAYTKAEADARFAAAVPLDDINTALTDLESRTTVLEAQSIPLSQKGAANGVASLGLDGKVPVGQLPAAIASPADAAPAVLAVGQAAAIGASAKFMRSDAKAGLPGPATQDAPGFMSADDKFKLDALAGGRSALDVGFSGPVSDVLVVGTALYAVGSFLKFGSSDAWGIAKLSLSGQLDGRWQSAWGTDTQAINLFTRLARVPDGGILAMRAVGGDGPTARTGGRPGYTGQSVQKFLAAGGLDPDWVTTHQLVFNAISTGAAGQVVCASADQLFVLNAADGSGLATKAATGNINALRLFGADQLFISQACFNGLGAATEFDGRAEPHGLKRMSLTDFTLNADWNTGGGTGANCSRIGRLVVGSDGDGDYLVAANPLAFQGDSLPGGGADQSWNGGSLTDTRGLLKLRSDGTADPDFTINLTVSAGGTAEPFAVDSLGRIYFGGAVTSINGTDVTPNQLYRVTTTGAFDAVIDGFDGTVLCLALAGDDRLIVGGDFTSYHGLAFGHLAILRADGSVASLNTDAALPDNAGLILPATALPDVGADPTAVRNIYRITTPALRGFWLYDDELGNWARFYPAAVAPLQLPLVTFDPAGGEAIGGGLDVNLACPGYGTAEIRYTLDGSVPTALSTLYAAAIHIAADTTIKAIARLAGYATSDVAVAQYAADALTQLADVVIAPDSGTPVPVTISMAHETPDVEIRYTLDGSTPTAASTLYTVGITLNGAATVRAVAFLVGYLPSNPVAATFPALTRVPTPTGDDTTLPILHLGDGSPANAVIRYRLIPRGTWSDLITIGPGDSLAKPGGGGYVPAGYNPATQLIVFRAFATGYAPSLNVLATPNTSTGGTIYTAYIGATA